MEIHRFEDIDELSRYAEDWDRLTHEVPTRSWAWLSTWWRHYGPRSPGDERRRLSVIALIESDGRLVLAAPWYVERSAVAGRVLRMLGSGEVCSDYLSLLCAPPVKRAAIERLADYLAANAVRDWDLIELAGVDAEDAAANELARALADRNCTVHRRAGLNCWRVALPDAFEDYFAIPSKSKRRGLRKLVQNYIDGGRTTLHRAQSMDELHYGMALLIELHQRRRQSLGEPGSFASPSFRAFFDDVVPAMFRQGQLHFYWLTVDDRPVAAEYLLAGGDTLYAYQAGIDPEALEHQPGKVAYLSILRQAISEGFRTFDFLRGDEPYKAALGAAPRPSIEIRIAAPGTAARLRHGLWVAGTGVKQWLKQQLRPPKNGAAATA